MAAPDIVMYEEEFNQIKQIISKLRIDANTQYDAATSLALCEKIRQFESQPRGPSYVFGSEESYGYLIGTHVRDKDAVTAYDKDTGRAAWRRPIRQRTPPGLRPALCGKSNRYCLYAV